MKIQGYGFRRDVLIAALALSLGLPVWAQTTGGTAGQAQEAAQTEAAKSSGQTAAQEGGAVAAPLAPGMPDGGVAVPGSRSQNGDQHDGKHVPSKYDVGKIGSRGIGNGVNFYSLEKEQLLGKELAQEVEQNSRLVSDRVVTEYVNRVGQNLVRNSDAKVPFTIKVIDDETINAFALPGGFFYVNSGLILAADNEAELAGVMAHEIAHVAARHATKQATKGQIINLASIPLIFLGGPAGYAVRQVAGIAVPMGFLKFSRDAEREADTLGLEYAYAAGYDPAEFVHFFETLKVKDRKKMSKIAKAFSTHPMTDDRIKRAINNIATMLPPKDEYMVTTSEFDEVKTRLAQIVNRGKINEAQTDRPTLRRRGGNDKNNDEKQDKDRPTLRRRTE